MQIRSSRPMVYLRKHGFFFFFLLLCLLGGIHQSYSEEEIGDNWFSIESRTVLVSAQCVIDGGNQDDDKKRRTVGVGEEIVLTAGGKALDDAKVVVEWKLVSGDDIAMLQIDPRDSASAKLTIKKDAKNDGNVTVEAKAKKDGEEIAAKKADFETKVPSNIKAKHSGLRVEGRPASGDKVNVGASSKLVLILEPLSVSFVNITIREKAEDTPDEVANNWMGVHNTGDGIGIPDDQNEVRYDKIGVGGATVQQIQNWKHFGVKAVWKCGWYVYDDNAYHCKISNNDYQQVFLITKDGLRPETILQEIKASVSKFGCVTARSTAGIAFHEDTP